MARSASVDPLDKFRFVVAWSSDGDSESTPTAKVGFHDVQMPKRTTNEITYRDGADPDINQKSPGLSNMEDVVMSRGLIAQDDNNEFYKWASAVHRPTEGHVGRDALTAVTTGGASNNFRKDVTITQLDREGQPARRWVAYNAWPKAFTPGSDLDASEDGEKSLEQITLAYEDFKEVKLDAAEEKDVSASLP